MKRVRIIILIVCLLILIKSISGIIENSFKQEVKKLKQEIEELKMELKELQKIKELSEKINKYKSDKNSLAVAYYIFLFSRKYAKEDWKQLSNDIVLIGAIETRWNFKTIGKYGERGALQVLPSTFRALGFKNLSSWKEQLEAGIKYYSMCYKKAQGNKRLAFAYYNAGMSRRPEKVLKIARNYVEKAVKEGL